MADLDARYPDVAGQFGGRGRAAAALLAGEIQKGRAAGLSEAREIDKGFDIAPPGPVRGSYRGRDVPKEREMMSSLPGKEARADMDSVRRQNGRVQFYDLPFGRAYAAKGFLMASQNSLSSEKQRNHLASSSDRDLVYIGGRTAEAINGLIMKEIKMRTDFMLDSEVGRKKQLMEHYRKEFPGRDDAGVRQAVAEKVHSQNLDFDKIKSTVARFSGVSEDKVPSLSDLERGALKSASRGLQAISVEVARREAEKGINLGFKEKIGQLGVTVDKRALDIPIDIPMDAPAAGPAKNRPRARTRGSDAGMGM